MRGPGAPPGGGDGGQPMHATGPTITGMGTSWAVMFVVAHAPTGASINIKIATTLLCEIEAFPSKASPLLLSSRGGPRPHGSIRTVAIGGGACRPHSAAALEAERSLDARFDA